MGIYEEKESKGGILTDESPPWPVRAAGSWGHERHDLPRLPKWGGPARTSLLRKPQWIWIAFAKTLPQATFRRRSKQLFGAAPTGMLRGAGFLRVILLPLSAAPSTELPTEGSVLVSPCRPIGAAVNPRDVFFWDGVKEGLWVLRPGPRCNLAWV